ncbi:uncharacterized protein RCH25_025926 [Pelodytes ibericus]
MSLEEHDWPHRDRTSTPSNILGAKPSPPTVSDLSNDLLDEWATSCDINFFPEAPKGWSGGVTFDDVAVYFSEDEWEYLQEWQREVYKEVMRENFQLVTSVGRLIQRSHSDVERQVPYWLEQLPDKHTAEPELNIIIKEEAEEEINPSSKQDSQGYNYIAPGFGLMSSLLSGSLPTTSHVSSQRHFLPSPASQVFPSEDRAGTDRPFSCPHCHRSFIRKSHLTSHERTHRGERPYPCEVCGKRFHYRHHLVGHQRIHTGEKLFSCEHCGIQFNHKGNYQTHQRLHTGERPFSCDLCGKSFNRKADLITHCRVHTGERPFTCADCGKSFSRKQHLVTHRRRHTGETPFPCDQCEQSFAQRKALLRHQELVHSAERPHSCSQCGKGFACHSHLLTHQRAHQSGVGCGAGGKPFSCDQCRKSFVAQPHLQAHQKTHSGPQGGRPYTCTDCGKGFNSRQYLSRHQKIHTGERPFRCNVCGDSFIQKPNLERHKGIHSGQRPFPCLVCGGSFFKKHNLVRHQRIHTGERLHFSCKVAKPVTQPLPASEGDEWREPSENPCKNVCCNRTGERAEH